MGVSLSSGRQQMTDHGDEFHIDVRAKARNAHSAVLREFAEIGKSSAIAVQLGVDNAQITRLHGYLERVVHVIYLLGFKLVPASAVTVDQDELRGLEAKATRLMAFEKRNGRIEDEY